MWDTAPNDDLKRLEFSISISFMKMGFVLIILTLMLTNDHFSYSQIMLPIV